MTKFFVPANRPNRAEEVYQWIVRYVKAMLDCDIDPVRIFSLNYRHDGQEYRAVVGETDPRTGQLVVAILRSDCYLICTPYYGVSRGEPISIPFTNAIEVQYFEGLDNARENLKIAVHALDSGEGSIQHRLHVAATALSSVTLEDFPATIAGDYLSLQHRLSWHGGQNETIDAMTEDEAEATATAVRSLYVDSLAAGESDPPS
jgi:hypothetical protein